MNKKRISILQPAFYHILCSVHALYGQDRLLWQKPISS